MMRERTVCLVPIFDPINSRGRHLNFFPYLRSFCNQSYTCGQYVSILHVLWTWRIGVWVHADVGSGPLDM